MLVLTRKVEESLKIGTDIEVKVLEIRGNSVRLGIIAPPQVSVHRKEIYELIQRENILAAQREKSLPLNKLLRKKESI